ADEAAQQRTGDPQQYRDDESAGIATGHQQLGNDAHDETKHYPRQNAHQLPPRSPRGPFCKLLTNGSSGTNCGGALSAVGGRLPDAGRSVVGCPRDRGRKSELLMSVASHDAQVQPSTDNRQTVNPPTTDNRQPSSYARRADLAARRATWRCPRAFGRPAGTCARSMRGAADGSGAGAGRNTGAVS